MNIKIVLVISFLLILYGFNVLSSNAFTQKCNECFCKTFLLQTCREFCAFVPVYLKQIKMKPMAVVLRPALEVDIFW